MSSQGGGEEGEAERRARKRAMIVQEVVASEETYLQRLLITRDVFVTPIRERGLLSASEIEGQFGGLEGIIELHLALAPQLSSTHPVDSLQVGQVFCETCPRLTVYKGYLKCFEKALVKRGKLLTSNRKFADYLVEAKSDPRSQGLTMESLLIEPVQRIPRYRLLLQDLLKNTPEDHVDFGSISAALESICSIATDNNEAIRQQEELDKVYQVMQQMEYNGSINLLDNENRKFIKQDDLYRQCRRGRKIFRFWLFNDKLLYGEASTPYILGKYNLNRDIPLKQCHVSGEEEKSEFVMRVQSPAKSFIVWFKEREHRDVWVEEVMKCIESCRSIADDEGEVALAPIWNPDAASSSCAMCNAEFSFINRKHHCRNCGCIVCDSCSRGRITLNHVDKNAPVRVCDECNNSSDKSTVPVRRHTAQININPVSSGMASGKFSHVNNTPYIPPKPLSRSQSSGPTYSSIKPAALSRSQSSTSKFVPPIPKPMDKAPPPPVPLSPHKSDTSTVNKSRVQPPRQLHAKPCEEAPPPPLPSVISDDRPPPPPAPPKPSKVLSNTKPNNTIPPSPPPPPPRPPPPPSRLENYESRSAAVSPTSKKKIPAPRPPKQSEKVNANVMPNKQPITSSPTKPVNGGSDIGDNGPNNHSLTFDKSSDSDAAVILSLEELQNLNESKRLSLLARNGIQNIAEKETYLSDADFLKHFGCDKITFEAWPAWKKTNKRKELGLF